MEIGLLFLPKGTPVHKRNERLECVEAMGQNPSMRTEQQAQIRKMRRKNDGYRAACPERNRGAPPILREVT